jgi:hypothetical protein
MLYFCLGAHPLSHFAQIMGLSPWKAWALRDGDEMSVRAPRFSQFMCARSSLCSYTSQKWTRLDRMQIPLGVLSIAEKQLNFKFFKHGRISSVKIISENTESTDFQIRI